MSTDKSELDDSIERIRFELSFMSFVGKYDESKRRVVLDSLRELIGDAADSIRTVASPPAARRASR